jgi:hypothetical protein
MPPCLAYDETDCGCDDHAVLPHPTRRATASSILPGNKSGVSLRILPVSLPGDLPRTDDTARAHLFTLRRLVAGTLAAVATSSILLFIDFLARHR